MQKNLAKLRRANEHLLISLRQQSLQIGGANPIEDESMSRRRACRGAPALWRNKDRSHEDRLKLAYCVAEADTDNVDDRTRKDRGKEKSSIDEVNADNLVITLPSGESVLRDRLDQVGPVVSVVEGVKGVRVPFVRITADGNHGTLRIGDIR